MTKIVIFSEQGYPVAERPGLPQNQVVMPANLAIRLDDGRVLAPDGSYRWHLLGAPCFGGLDGRTPTGVPDDIGLIGFGWDDLAEMTSAEHPYGFLRDPRPEMTAERAAREQAAAAAAAAAEAERVARMAVSMAQFRKALLAAGLLDDVLAIMADPATPRAIVIDWEYASEVRRDWPAWAQFLPILGKTDADLDALFIAAAGL